MPLDVRVEWREVPGFVISSVDDDLLQRGPVQSLRERITSAKENR
jgi:hypothetical protein